MGTDEKARLFLKDHIKLVKTSYRPPGAYSEDKMFDCDIYCFSLSTASNMDQDMYVAVPRDSRDPFFIGYNLPEM